MKIKSIEIQNFRSIKSDEIDFKNFNVLVGPNGSGKSTVLNAMNLFFGEINNFTVDDFHSRNTKEPILVKITFHELSDAAVEEFRHYTRSEMLIVHAEVADDGTGNFVRTIRGERMIFEPFKPFLKRLAQLNAEKFSKPCLKNTQGLRKLQMTVIGVLRFKPTRKP